MPATLASGWLRHAVFAVLSFIAGICIAEALIAAHVGRLSQREHQAVVNQVASTRSRLETVVSTTMAQSQGLAAFVVSADSLTPQRIESVLRTVCSSNPMIRNIGVAPDNVVRHVCPQQRNQAVLGFRYEDSPEQWPGVKRAMELRHAVVTGPVDLVQGGRAIVSRTPAYRPDSSYWGVISMVMELRSLLAQADLLTVSDGVRYWLIGDPLPGDEARMIMGDAATVPESALRMKVAVPGGAWTLVAYPVAGWTPPWTLFWLSHALGLLMSLILAWLQWALLQSRARARGMARELRELNERLTLNNRKLEELTRTDPLTGIANRRRFEGAYAEAWKQCRLTGQPLSLLMIDLDHFKAINDQHGHAVGDGCLIEVVRQLGAALQQDSQLLARYGGEEFVVLAPDLDAAGALELAAGIRLRIESCELTLLAGGSVPIRLTTSVGVATVVPTDSDQPGQLRDVADSALYEAKRAGRNCVRQRAVVRIA